MKKESIVVQKLNQYGAVIGVQLKDAIADTRQSDDERVNAMSDAYCKLHTYNKMIDILKGGSVHKLDMTPDSHYFKGMTVKDLQFLDVDKILEQVSDYKSVNYKGVK